MPYDWFHNEYHVRRGIKRESFSESDYTPLSALPLPGNPITVGLSGTFAPLYEDGKPTRKFRDDV